ncbi:MAG TPA: Maf family protein [Gallionellaceae bacterium]|nr:Maf family protein [Gallionellaceae bacterium]
MTAHPRIYLASLSPRRRDLLTQIGVKFEVLLLRADARRNADVDETPQEREAPGDYVLRIAQAKANAGLAALRYRRLPVFPVLAADTTVTLDGRILGKPADRDEATHMLRQLSGRQHRVLTAVAIAFDDRVEVRLSETAVTFVPLSEERIRRYVFTSEPHDKAGAYGIQGHAGAFVQRIEGSYSGVVGLPLAETAELLQLSGYPVP